MYDSIKLIECPRDAMQGMHHQINTADKIKYINALLDVGFHTLDCVSFVSPKAIPQMADSTEVLNNINTNSSTKLLAIIANDRGAAAACGFKQLHYLGYPFSVSETFQQRNTNASIEESKLKLKNIHATAQNSHKELVVYLSMAFGNPYNDEYSEDIILHHAEWLVRENIKIISLADTVGLATPGQITSLTTKLISQFPEIEVGLHLHSSTALQQDKLEAALQSGCKRIDGALLGYGGCPMAADDLVGNMDTAYIIEHLKQKNAYLDLNMNALAEAKQIAREIFSAA